MAELARPLTGPRPPTRAGDLAFCHGFVRRRSRTAYAAALALPARLRDDAMAVLAFRAALDDVVARPGASGAAARQLEARVAAARAGQPEEHPIDRAFSALVVAHQIPHALTDALVEGLGWDLARRRYATYDALVGHAARVGASLAAVMTVLAGERRPEAVAGACDLAVAMELTRVARDVGVDAAQGRLQLPLEWLEEARVDVDRFVMSPAPTRGVREVVLRLLRAAEPLYVRGEAGIAMLPADCRPALRGVRLLHAALGEELRRSGYDSVTRRVAVGTMELARLVSRALRPLPGELAPAAAPRPLEATRPLVEAVCAVG